MRRPGPSLLAIPAAFDKAVVLTLGAWRWILGLSLAMFAIVIFAPNAADALDNVSSFVIGIVAIGVAVRAVKPEFKLTWNIYWRIVGISILMYLAVLAGLIVFVLPGIWLFGKLSMSFTAPLLEDTGVGSSLSRSWWLTQDHFWQTLLFNALVIVALLICLALPFIGISALIDLLASVFSFKIGDTLVTQYSFAALTPFDLYTSIAGWLAYIYWFEALKAANELASYQAVETAGAFANTQTPT